MIKCSVAVAGCTGLRPDGRMCEICTNAIATHNERNGRKGRILVAIFDGTAVTRQDLIQEKWLGTGGNFLIGHTPSAIQHAVAILFAEQFGKGAEAALVQELLPKSFDLGAGRNSREQDPSTWKKTKSYTPSGDPITPSTVHKDVQSFLKSIGGKVEKGLIDWLNIVAWELKPEWTTARFYEALGKAISVQDEYGYDVGLMGLYPIGEKAMSRLTKRGISYACLNWIDRKIDVANSFFATDSAKESLKALLS